MVRDRCCQLEGGLDLDLERRKLEKDDGTRKRQPKVHPSFHLSRFLPVAQK